MAVPYVLLSPKFQTSAHSLPSNLLPWFLIYSVRTMNNLNLRTTALALTACLSLVATSCSTTKPIAATSQGHLPGSYDGKSIAKYAADGTLETVGTVLGAGGMGLMSVIYVIGGIGYGFDGSTPPWD